MAQLLQAFNAQQFDPTQGGGSLPVGRHPVVIESSEVKANKANDGGYLQLNLKLIDGPQQGTTGAYRLNLYHSNPQTAEIAHRQLSAICHVIGVFNVQDSQQLHNIPFIIEVGFQKGHEPGSNPEAKGYTEVKKVFDINGHEPGKAGQGAPAAQPQQQPAQGGFGQQQPQQPQGGAAWGGGQQPAQQPAAQPQGNGAPAWGGQPAQQQPQGAPAGNAPAWGGAPAQQPAQQPTQQPAAWGQQQGGAAPQANAPWGAR